MSTAEPAITDASVLRKLLRAMADAEKKPQPKRIHRLRTSTRRAEAALRASGQKPKLIERLREVRKLAGKVRSADVQLELLQGISEAPAKEKQLLREHLEQVREKRERKLLQFLDGRRAAVVQTKVKALLKRLPTLPANRARVGNAVQQAAAGFEAAWKHYHPFTAENLHEFRTQCKQLRYLAELGPETPQRETVIAGLVRIQDAVGAWHDRDELLATAVSVLRTSPPAALISTLRTRVADAYRAAQRTVAESRELIQVVQSKRAPQAIESGELSVAARSSSVA